jgi:hypothetical protein
MNLQDHYVDLHMTAIALATRVEDLIQDYPDPECPELTWGHVAELARIIEQLREILGEETTSTGR